VEVGGLFGGVAEDIRDRANSSREAEVHERGAREDSYTDEFVYQMRTSITKRINEVAGRLSNLGTRVEIHFHPTNLPVSEENQYGADNGIRVTMRTQEAMLVKSVLIQCKRIYGSSTNASCNELAGRGEKQARDIE